MIQKSITLQYMAKQLTRKGSYTLEAAIFLPIFIVGIMSVAFTIRMIETSENITFAATDEMRVAAASAYNMPVSIFFEQHLENRLIAENDEASKIDVSEFRYLHQTDDIDGLISFQTDYWVGTGLPLGMIDGSAFSQRLMCRGFIGRTIEGKPISFDEMETDGQGSLVWLFPVGGTKYHVRSCPFVSSYPVQAMLTAAIKENFDPCQKCGSQNAEIGSQVYCFQSYGENYHVEGCPAVEKYVVSMEKEQAEARGYTPCQKCGGAE